MSALLLDRRTGGTNPAEVITTTLGGRTFRAGRRTVAHLEFTIAELARQHPGATLHVIQGCYNTGVAASAYTHDFDGVLDVSIEGLGWRDAEQFLRYTGWAAWLRQPPTFSWHIHMVSLGCPGPVGIYVPGQVDDYYRGALGLKGQHDSGSDPAPRPSNINATVFDFEAWEQELEDTMKPEDFQRIDDLLQKRIQEAFDKLGDVSIENVKAEADEKPQKMRLSALLFDIRNKARD